jgi:hypothetical protein
LIYAKHYKYERIKEQMVQGRIFKQNEEELPNVPYQSIIGAIGYAVTVSRPDCAYSNGILRRYQNCYGRDQWKAAKTILKYLSTTKDKGLCYEKSSAPIISAYVDASFADDLDDRKSTQGYIVYLGNGPIAWKSNKQKKTAQSRCESEWMALGEVVKEIIWIRSLLFEIGVPQDRPTKVFCDNQAAIAITKNPQHHERTKHIDIRYHFVRDELEAKTIELVYIPTMENAADIMTKALGKKLFNQHSDKLVRTGRSVKFDSSNPIDG